MNAVIKSKLVEAVERRAYVMPDQSSAPSQRPSLSRHQRSFTWGVATERGYASSKWMTYKQAQELGGHARKGEHGSLVVYADAITKTEENDRGEEVEHSILFIKGYTVFNAEQIEGLQVEYYDRPEPKSEPMQSSRRRSNSSPP